MRRSIRCAVATLAVVGSVAWSQGKPDPNTAKIFNGYALTS